MGGDAALVSPAGTRRRLPTQGVYLSLSLYLYVCVYIYIYTASGQFALIIRSGHQSMPIQTREALELI